MIDKKNSTNYFNGQSLGIYVERLSSWKELFSKEIERIQKDILDCDESIKKINNQIDVLRKEAYDYNSMFIELKTEFKNKTSIWYAIAGLLTTIVGVLLYVVFK